MDHLKEILSLSVPTKEQEEEVKTRLKRYEMGESKTYSWEEMISKLKSDEIPKLISKRSK